MTETHETACTACAVLPPLARSITEKLTDLAAHGYRHGHHDATADHEPGVEMPQCLASEVAELGATLYGLTRAEEADSTISTTLVVPVDGPPEDFVENLQKAIGEALEHLGGQQ